MTGVLLSLVLPSKAKALTAARARVRELLESEGLDERARYVVELVLDELGGNIVRYGYEPGDHGEIQIELCSGARAVLVTLIDDGRPFDPTAHPEPPTPTSIEDARIGGLGISMVRKMVAGMRYSRTGGRNRVEVEVARAG